MNGKHPLGISGNMDVWSVASMEENYPEKWALAPKQSRENDPGPAFLGRSAPSSLSARSADSVVTALKGTSVFLNWGIIHSRMYTRAIFRMCRLEIMHFIFSWGFRLCFILGSTEWALLEYPVLSEGGRKPWALRAVLCIMEGQRCCLGLLN